MNFPERPRQGEPALSTPQLSAARILYREWHDRLVDLVAPFKRLVSPGHPLHCGESYRPFFIIGPPRSGNTLLRRILLAHPGLHIPPENLALRHCIRLYRQHRRLLRWEQLVDLQLAEFSRRPASDSWEMGDLRELTSRLRQLPAGERSLAALLNELYVHHAERCGRAGSRWGEKSPLNIYCLHRLPKIFPDAQFIFLIRDPADVVYSWITHWGGSLEAAASRWIYTANNVRYFARRHPRESLVVRYEVLVTRTEETIRELAEFLCLDLTPPTLAAMIDSEDLAATMGDVPRLPHHASVTSRIHSRSIGQGRRRLSPEQKRSLDSFLRSNAEAFLYERLV